MKKLTNKELEALTVAALNKKLIDDGGLWAKVRPNQSAKNGVSATFWYRYRQGKKSKDAPCGTWPRDSLQKIRLRRDAVRELVRSGIDPAVQREVSRLKQIEADQAALAAIDCQRIESLTVSDLFDDWQENGVRRKDNNAELCRSFRADILPCIGDRHVKEIAESDLRKLLKKAVDRGANRTAVVLRNNLVQMFAWAEKRPPWRKLLAEGNPAELVDIQNIVPNSYDMQNPRSRVLSQKEIRELHEVIDSLKEQYTNAENRRTACHPISDMTEISFWLMLSTLCRVGELSMARWEHVDLTKGEWFIPRDNVKGRTGDFTVFLSDFAQAQFVRLYEISGSSEWCFPASHKSGHICVKSISKQVGDRQIMFKKNREGGERRPMMHRAKAGNSLVLANGKNGAWTPHDLRRTGATMMQGLGVQLDVIDRCQNHVLVGSKVRRHYLHHDYAKEKREAWQQLGNALTSILSKESNVVFINAA